MITRRALKLLDPSKLPKDPEKSSKRLAELTHVLQENLLPNLDKEIKSDDSYLVSNQITVLDIIAYMELNQVLSLYEWTLPQGLAKLNTWYDKMGEDPIIQKYSARLGEVLEAHPELMEPTAPKLSTIATK